MTENEAIERIKTMAFMCDDFHNCKYGHDCTDGCMEAVKMATKALEKLKVGKDNMVISSSDLMTILNSDSEELKQYKEVGTIDEFKALKEKSESKKIIQTVENGKMKRVFSCCGTDCTQMTSWMTPKFCPNCGSKIKT